MNWKILSMGELEAKKLVSLCGPFSDEAKIIKQAYFMVVNAYNDTYGDFSLNDFQSKEWQQTMDDMIAQFGFQNHPTIQFGMAKRMYDSGMPDKGWEYLKQAIKYFSHDKKPGVMITDIISLMLKNNMANYAVALGEKAVKRFPNDAVMHSTLGNCYIHAGRANEGVEFLSRAIKSFPNNEVMHNTLGNCYIHAGRANEGVRFLSEAIKRFRNDVVMHNTLGNCYIHAGRADKGVRFLSEAIKRFPNNEVMHNTLVVAAVEAKMRRIFDWLKPRLSMLESQIDYLDAKLSFLSNDSAQARKILEPYVFKDEKCKNSILGLYLACVGDDAGIHALLPLFRSSITYEFLLKCRDKWRENPLRDDLGLTDTYSSSWRVFTEGANAASRADRVAAGLGRGTPVHVKPR